MYINRFDILSAQSSIYVSFCAPYDGKNDKEGYITLEFRQNAYGDEPLMPGQGLVSFKLDKIADRIPGKTGLNIRVKSLHDGEYYKTIDFKTDEN